MIPIYKPYMPEGITSEIEQILYSGNLSYGKYGKLFEESIRGYIGNNKTISVSSYNHAMLIALSVLDLKPGDEVIASPVSCLASNQPFAIKNLKVIWADVNPLTGSLCPNDVKKRITKQTKAIFHNHFCGFIGEVDKINAIARENGLFVIDDCIEAFGSEYQGSKMGNLSSDLSVFSFQTVRLPNTIDGAAISFSSDKLFEKAKRIRDYGIDRTKFRDSNGEINIECDIEHEGYGALMSEINSFIGIKQMEVIGSLLNIQRKNAAVWSELINSMTDIQSLEITANTLPNYWVYGVICKNKIEVMKKFREEGWYATGVHINNNIYSVFGNKVDLPGVNEFMKGYLALPCGWWVKNENDL